MKAYAVLSGVLALCSLGFVDNYIQPGIAKAGRAVLVLSSIAFLITESIYLMT